ncbi:MAG: hypothetical protein A3F16_07400 [Deltaproteobacteria bacterium RIFCSPHIGHO2_12_FULL_43_9]|nr:MAG: hypothetical protein A3F16_07400 [Deltaproteobacteria bacterium RIFCSPHIGHO2_12_FULL_43_9]
MLKKTTIYLSGADLEILKQLSFLNNTSMTEVIRQGIQNLCESMSSAEWKAMEALDNIRKDIKNSGRSSKEIRLSALKAQKEVRGGKKTGRR